MSHPTLPPVLSFDSTVSYLPSVVRARSNTASLNSRIDHETALTTHTTKMKLLLHTALLATVAIAAPAAHWDHDSDSNGGRGAYNGWDGSSKNSPYADFGRRWHRGRDSQRGSCDLKNAVMPAGMLNTHRRNVINKSLTPDSTRPSTASSSRPNARPCRYWPW